MYKIKIVSGFSGAHSLRGYRGKCEELHGHNWKVEVIVCSKKLDSIGIVIDFSKLKSILNSVLEELDHKYLNDLDYFKKNNPTSENIAYYIFNKVKKSLNKNINLVEVNVWETDNSCASYSD